MFKKNIPEPYTICQAIKNCQKYITTARDISSTKQAVISIHINFLCGNSFNGELNDDSDADFRFINDRCHF